MVQTLDPYRCLMNILSVKKLAGDVYQVILQEENKKCLTFFAGQYLMLHCEEGEDSAYSIASSPIPASESIELHIQSNQNSNIAVRVINFLKQEKKITVTLPLGNCFINQESLPDTPLVFIAATTGFSQMKSYIEFTREISFTKPQYLYWGVRQSQGFYMPNLPYCWAKENLIEYHPIVSEAHEDDNWEGRFGLLYEAVLQDKHLFSDAHFFIGGSPAMVYNTVDALVASGFSESVMHSDVFDYAPRNTTNFSV